MKILLKLSVIAIIALAGVIAIAAGRSRPATSVSAAETSESGGSPRSIYRQNCSRCHGIDGRAQTAKGRELEADDLTGSEAKGLSSSKSIRIITRGKGKMPAFGRKLTPAQIQSVANYIRSL